MVVLVAENASSDGRKTVTECVASSLSVELLLASWLEKEFWPVALEVDERDSGAVK